MRILSSGATWYRVLVEFDLSSIPSGSTINTASLQLYYEGVVNAPVGRTYTANRVTTNWVEGNGNGGGTTGATWNKPDQSQTPTWTTNGGDYTTTGAASQVVPATFGYMTWDVTAIVKAWIEGGQPNYGFLMKDLNENVLGTVGAYFWTREYGSFMPILTVDYSATPAPSGPTTPVGGFMEPVSKLAIVAPWLAVIGLVGIGTVVVVARKREK
jgi:hypothetical protein